MYLCRWVRGTKVLTFRQVISIVFATMRFVALLSGGKDSVHCMLHCIANGHVPVVIGNLRPPKIDEMDSFMYQTVGHEMIEYIAEALNLPLVRQDIIGGSVRTDMQYMKTQGDEVHIVGLLIRSK